MQESNAQGAEVGRSILRYGRSNNGLSHYLVRPGKRAFGAAVSTEDEGPDVDPGDAVFPVLFSRSLRDADADDEANIYSRLVKKLQKRGLNNFMMRPTRSGGLNKRGLNNFMLRPTRAFSGFLIRPKDIVEKLLDEYSDENQDN